MGAATRDPARRAPTSRALGWATALLLVSGLAQFVLGVTALGGVDTFEDNVLEIESNEAFGDLYFSLATWGAIAVVLGLGQVAGCLALVQRTRNAVLGGLVAAYLGLGGSVFTLAVFRWATLVVIPAQIVVIYLLSYHGGKPWEQHREDG